MARHLQAHSFGVNQAPNSFFQTLEKGKKHFTCLIHVKRAHLIGCLEPIFLLSTPFDGPG
jgi:hypothetical protein